MRIVFVDASDSLGRIAEDRLKLPSHEVMVNRHPDIRPEELPAVLKGATVALIDHTALPDEVAARCPDLRHVVFLGTGARSYMNPEALAERGIAVHTIKGYGDTAVAECAFALMWAAAKGLARMDREMRAGNWLRTDGMELTGKTLGVIGFGGIGSEMARLAHGIGMRVLAWNRSAKSYPGVTFTDLDTVLTESHVVSLHLLLSDETRSFLSRQRLAAMRRAAILVNTARGALIDEQALIEALSSGQLGHAALDVFTVEPLPADHPLTHLSNVTLSAHSAFRTPEAANNLIAAAFDHCRRIASGA